ncbi:MBL fold metallo-hydrolase [Thermobifida halotolerans]|uniref:MBL fold metallo-hydrolase n=1 Tax=Thermobifida halotolerans TaxID=483545 RepID=A0A399G7Q4_9ACTN|nr:MBL fold metallo-hydrolase [Thermobifida halotolerans]UOE20969.1 MBL fold metallo-hydrolase [Thermobifida halotolerans]
MRLTKLGHACVRLEKDGRSLVIDPGEMTPESDALTGVDAVLVTHEHFDHLAPDRLRAAAADNPELTVYTCPGAARQLADLGDRVRVVRDGETFPAAGFEVVAAGEKHRMNLPDVPPIDNVGFLVDGEVFHPGDAWTVVEAPTVLPALQAPWLTVADLVRYLRAVAPRRAYAVHDGLLNERGLAVFDGVLAGEARRSGADVRRLRPGESVEL